MGKKKDPGASKATAKAAKKAKVAKKVEKREKKKTSKPKEEEENLEDVLEQMQKEWEEAHTVTEEVSDGPPSRRAHATLTACPNGNHLWCIGGEFFSEDGKAYFYNDVYRYSPEKDTWVKFVSPTCPGPRSAHAVVACPVGGGKLFLFGGEFSSVNQNTFHHYRDFWCFDITTHSWDRIDTKVRPSARSGHRMVMWKHFVVLFGGFYDPGITTRYMNDLWLFDTQEYKWRLVEMKETERKPSPRSGFSFLPTPDGVVLHGGYCKEYAKGKRPIGINLDDTWFLKMTLNNVSESKSAPAKDLEVKWERRKRPSTAYAPSVRSGCTMTLWSSKNMGILFGGVTDEDNNEETLESVFWNDLNGYQLSGNGRWVSLTLKPKKNETSAKKKRHKPPAARQIARGFLDEENDNGDISDAETEATLIGPQSTIPLPRYNAMLAVLRNTLYLYGGIFERGSREYTLDDFYSLQLDKLDRYVCLKESGIVIPDEEETSSDEDYEDDDEDSESEDGDEEGTVAEEESINEEKLKSADQEEDRLSMEPQIEEPQVEDVNALRSEAVVFIGVSKSNTRSEEEVISTPLPGETLSMFYARSREYWAQKAHTTSENRGKSLRRDGFTLAEERYTSYKPILDEVEKILAEAGLDEEEMRTGFAGGQAGSSGLGVQSRNRR